MPCLEWIPLAICMLWPPASHNGHIKFMLHCKAEIRKSSRSIPTLEQSLSKRSNLNPRILNISCGPGLAKRGISKRIEQKAGERVVPSVCFNMSTVINGSLSALHPIPGSPMLLMCGQGDIINIIANQPKIILYAKSLILNNHRLPANHLVINERVYGLQL